MPNALQSNKSQSSYSPTDSNHLIAFEEDKQV